MAEEQRGEVLSHEDVPQPGHWSTKIEANKTGGTGSDYVSNKDREDYSTPERPSVKEVGTALKRLYNKDLSRN